MHRPLLTPHHAARFLVALAALYRAAQTPAGLIAYGRFFLHMSFHLLFCVWMVLGLPKVGDWAAGVFRMISWFALGTPKGTALGFFAIANIAVWSLVRRRGRVVCARCHDVALTFCVRSAGCSAAPSSSRRPRSSALAAASRRCAARSARSQPPRRTCERAAAHTPCYR